MKIDGKSVKSMMKMLGVQIKLARKKANMTHEQVAKKSGMSVKAVINAEKGKFG